MAGCVTCGSVECDERDGPGCVARSQYKSVQDTLQASMKKIAKEIEKAADDGRFLASFTVALMTDGSIRLLVPDGAELTTLVGLAEIGKANVISRFQAMARGEGPRIAPAVLIPPGKH